jgi:ACDE family multidrug resistance protein
VLVALVIVVAGHRWLRRVDADPVDALEEAQAVTAGDA